MSAARMIRGTVVSDRHCRSGRPVLVSWSTGKDSAFMLQALRDDPAWEPVGLVTTVAAASKRVPLHGLPRPLLEEQARLLDLPLQVVEIPHPCPNREYERRLAPVWVAARATGVGAVAYGDLFLADVRAYRERQLAGTGLEPVFPLWGRDTAELASAIVATGWRALVTCVDPVRLDRTLLGRWFDHDLLADLPADVDPCAENGEFHTVVVDGPLLSRPLPVRVAGGVDRDGFWQLELQAAAG
ncbi:MAG: ATP-binding protein [Candidatus Krumholzibacteriia bacterium]